MMGVSLEKGQFRFASIIQELSKQPATLSQFVVWVDLCVAEYKTNGFISLNCIGMKPMPGWLEGLRDYLGMEKELSSPDTSFQRSSSNDVMIDRLIYQGKTTLNITMKDQRETTRDSNTCLSNQGQIIQNSETCDPHVIVVDTKEEKEATSPCFLDASSAETNNDSKIRNSEDLPTSPEKSNYNASDINGNSKNGDGCSGSQKCDSTISNPKYDPDCADAFTSNKPILPSPSNITNTDPIIIDSPSKKIPENKSPGKRKSGLISDFLHTAKLKTIKVERDTPEYEAVEVDPKNQDDLPILISDIRSQNTNYTTVTVNDSGRDCNSQDFYLMQYYPSGNSNLKATTSYNNVATQSSNPHSNDVYQNSLSYTRPDTSTRKPKVYIPGPVRKARTNVGNMHTWLKEEFNDFRNIEDMPPDDLDNYLAQFLTNIRKRNGEEYDYNSFKDIRGSIERHLRDRFYPYSIIKGNLFPLSKKAYIVKRDLLRQGLSVKAENVYTCL